MFCLAERPYDISNDLINRTVLRTDACIVIPTIVMLVMTVFLPTPDSCRMGDCQLDDLLDMLDDDDGFEEATVDDPGPVEDRQGDVDEEGDDDGADEEMAEKLRQMEEEVSLNRNLFP